MTASGLTLLGADDKAGVAEIMAAAEHLVRHPEIRHGAIRVAFTPDEEIGRGADRFDVARFGAVCAYTLDGGGLGELEYESFSADAVTVTFKGFNTHPGYAKGRMVNAIRVAADFVAAPSENRDVARDDRRVRRLPASVPGAGRRRSDERQGPAPGLRDSSAARTRRSSSSSSLARSSPHIRAPRLRAVVEESYRNMREVLEQHPQVVEHARDAIRRAGLEPVERPIRGGTDGSRLSFMGLPTPNLFAGEHNFHSRLEWVSAQDMDKAVEVIVRLCERWAE